MILLALLLLSAHLSGIDRIAQEYPELVPFFESVEFKDKIGSCEIICADLPAGHIASLSMAMGSSGTTQSIIVNVRYITRNLFTPEEFKFILCHELGHLNDSKLLMRTVVPFMGVNLLTTGVLGWAASSLVRKEWCLALEKFAAASAVYLAGNLLCAEFFRQGEFYADAYALALTGNLDAAVSALEKRKLLVPRTTHDLVDDHPHEDVRIAHLNALT